MARRGKSNGSKDIAGLTIDDLVNGYLSTQLLYVAATLGIAEMVADAPLSADQLAAQTGSHASSLFRVRRALAALGMLTQDGHDRFGLSERGQRLRADLPDSVAPFLLSYGQAWWWRSTGELLHSVMTGQSAFEHLHGMRLFQYLDGQPEAAAIFHANMTAMTRAEADAVVDAYDFPDEGTLVDVGGGHGALVTAVLHARPNVRAVLFDQPAVVAGAERAFSEGGIAERCQIIGGSFFQTVPTGGDVYTLKDIVHDWEDELAVELLRACRRAMDDRARLLVIERILPPGDAPSPGKLVDVMMLALTGGRERTLPEYRVLLEGAGLRLAGTTKTATGLDVIEARPFGSSSGQKASWD